MNDAQTKLGKAPTRIEVDALTLTLGGQSTGVSTLDQVYTGDVDVAMVTDDTNSTYDVGHILNPTGVGPDDIDISFASSALAPADFAKLLAGSFKVVVRGPSAPGFAASGADANLQLTFTFAAYE